jgi:hypothetical protein
VQSPGPLGKRKQWDKSLHEMLYRGVSSNSCALSALPHQVYAFGKPRSNPNAKDSQWVRDRAELESQKPGVSLCWPECFGSSK